jgi:hypothetical protein
VDIEIHTVNEEFDFGCDTDDQTIELYKGIIQKLENGMFFELENEDGKHFFNPKHVVMVKLTKGFCTYE